jgi:hypothetical protein
MVERELSARADHGSQGHSRDTGRIAAKEQKQTNSKRHTASPQHQPVSDPSGEEEVAQS